MKLRIFLSVFTIVMVVSGIAAASYAYFTDGKVLGNNTFSTGTVTIGDFNVSGLSVTGLVPGVPKVIENIGVNYIGTINADIYIGARGTSQPGDTKYIADKLYLRIYKQGTSNLVWEGWTNALSTNWIQVADNVPGGWQAYDLQFTLDPSIDNTHQGVSNTDTELLFYAVQDGGPVPTGYPYTKTGTDWFNL
jgi:predicted ribosomally synthesized peptide with SipW-like signal peptide